MAPRNAFPIRKLFWPSVMTIIFLVASDLFYQAFCADVSFLSPMRQCKNHISEHETDPTKSCPLSGDLLGYEIFQKEVPKDSTSVVVLAADRGLFHRQRISLDASPLRFGMVLLSNGDVVRWVGTELDYRVAVDSAHRNADCRSVEVFFKKSAEYEKVVSARRAPL